MNFPFARDASSAAGSVADAIAELALPQVEAFSDILATIEDLPDLPVPRFSPSPDGEPPMQLPESTWSRMDAARVLSDECTNGIAAMKRHQNQCAALVAVLIERLESSALLEAGILALDGWQRQTALTGIRAEIAAVLQIPEGVANRLIQAATALVRQCPATLRGMNDGEVAWDYAFIIVEECELLRTAGIAAETIDSFESILLTKAQNATLPSFREKARRLRERSYPETITPRTLQAYSNRSLQVSRARDGMSWLSLYAPSPTVEGIWDQCTLTAQAAQGVHEERTLKQLRADVAATLLLNQSMAQNNIYAPPTPALAEAIVPAPASNEGSSKAVTSGSTDCGSEIPAQLSYVSDSYDDVEEELSRLLPSEAELCSEGAFPDPGRGEMIFAANQLPSFEDPDYSEPAFREPDIRNGPDWIDTANPPQLLPMPQLQSNSPAQGPGYPSAQMGSSTEGKTASSSAFFAPSAERWPPLPQAMPIVVVPLLSLLGSTNEPAWMEGAGPISMDVAKRLMDQAPSLYRVITDPISNKPLDCAPQQYRITKAMRTMLRIRDEYCQFPGCTAKAAYTEVDHIRRFGSGGLTIFDNLECLCKHHHQLKHFKDDRTRSGHHRSDQTPERAAIRLRGWTPSKTESGVAWTSPSGRYIPPESPDIQGPRLPKWLMKIVRRKFRTQYFASGQYLLDYPEIADEGQGSSSPDDSNDD